MAISSDAEQASDRHNPNPKRKMSLVPSNNSARTRTSFKIGAATNTRKSLKIGVAPNMFSNPQEPSGEKEVPVREKVDQADSSSPNRILGIAFGGLLVGGLVGFLIARRKR
jgi:hypothetical protein